MRIYTGWRIKSLCDDSSHLNGAEIRGSNKIRGNQFYYLHMPNGETHSIKRSELLSGIMGKMIEFYI